MATDLPKRPLVVVEYEPSWPGQFDRIASRLSSSLSAIPARIEHVGSTSVPGLTAKPIIDVTVVIERERDRRPVIESLVGLGYVHYGDLGIEGRDALRHPDDDPPHNLYVGLASAPSIRNHLAFRDALRADPALVREYSALKTRLAQEHAGDIDAYTEAKSAFIACVLAAWGFDAGVLDSIEQQNRADARPT